MQQLSLIHIYVGNVIPLDGEVINGEAMVNQASMTGESVPVKKEAGSYVYAGTAVEEGAVSYTHLDVYKRQAEESH